MRSVPRKTSTAFRDRRPRPLIYVYLPSYTPLIDLRQVDEENGQEGLGGFYPSPQNVGTTESGAAVEHEEDDDGVGGVAALSEGGVGVAALSEEGVGAAVLSGEQTSVDGGGEKEQTSPTASGVLGDSAGVGAVSSETPPTGEPQHPEDDGCIAHDASHIGGLEAAQQEVGILSNSGDAEDAESANGFAESGSVGVAPSETTGDSGAQHHRQQNNSAITHGASHAGDLEPAQQEVGLSYSEEEADAKGANRSAESELVGVLSSETSDDRTQHQQEEGVIAHGASHAGDLEPAQQEAGLSYSGEADAEDADGSAESGSVGVLSSETPGDGTQHRQLDGIAHDASITGRLETAQQGAGISLSRDGEGEGGLEVPSMDAEPSADALPDGDGAREKVAEHPQREESDELYDIDDLELSSSEGKTID